MSGQPIRFWNSIVIRFSLFFTGLILFAILLSGYLVYRKSSVVIIDSAKERLEHSVELAEQSFQAQLNEVSNDIALIAGNLVLRNYVNNQTTDQATALGQLFSSTLENKPDYFQIRLIDQMGKEIIRYDKKDNLITQIPYSDLQQKGDRDYFQEAIEMNKGQYYFSRINLNEEYGVVSEPAIVTLRAASPVFDQLNNKVGLLVINVDLERFYERLSQISSSGIFSLLLDEDGQYLYHPQSEKEFFKQRNTIFNFSHDYQYEITTLHEGVGQFKDRHGNQYIDYLKILHYMEGRRSIFLLSAIDEGTLLESAKQVRRESLRNLAIVCLIAILLSYLFTRLFSEQINSVTRAIAKYEQGETDIRLPTERSDEIGLLAKSFATMRDQVNQTLHELNKSLGEEKKAKAQRDEFLQNMSHELRTPLHTIQGLTSLLKKNKPTDAQKPIISSLEKSVENLSALVYDVLDHQKLVEGKVNIQLKATEIGTLLHDIHSNYQYDAVSKGIAFKQELSSELFDHLYLTDPLRLGQIVTNLIVNAIKYTRQGTILLKAGINQETGALEILVKDTGIGIHAENLEKINTRNYQETPDLIGRYGGYGLGLSIVKQLTTLLDGSVSASSQKDQGSTFKLSIPVQSVGQNNESIEPYQGPNNLPPISPSPVIFHLEDDPSSQELFVHMISPEIFQLHQFKEFEQFESAIKIHPPDLIVTDLILQQNDIHQKIVDMINLGIIQCPLIVVSAKEEEELDTLSPYHFQKPFDTSLLADMIYSLLGRTFYEQPIFESIYQNYDGDKQKINRVLDLLQIEFQDFISRLEMLDTTNPDLTDWRAIVHKLITHARTLHLKSIVSLLKDKDKFPDQKTIDRISNTLKYCQCLIRLEKHINSKD